MQEKVYSDGKSVKGRLASDKPEKCHGGFPGKFQLSLPADELPVFFFCT